MHGSELLICPECRKEILWSYYNESEYQIITECKCSKQKFKNIDEVLNKLNEENNEKFN